MKVMLLSLLRESTADRPQEHGELAMHRSDWQFGYWGMAPIVYYVMAPWVAESGSANASEKLNG